MIDKIRWRETGDESKNHKQGDSRMNEEVREILNELYATGLGTVAGKEKVYKKILKLIKKKNNFLAEKLTHEHTRNQELFERLDKSTKETLGLLAENEELKKRIKLKLLDEISEDKVIEYEKQIEKLEAEKAYFIRRAYDYVHEPICSAQAGLRKDCHICKKTEHPFERIVKENEKLKIELQESREYATESEYEILKNEYEELKAENEELRETLKKSITFEDGVYVGQSDIGLRGKPVADIFEEVNRLKKVVEVAKEIKRAREDYSGNIDSEAYFYFGKAVVELIDGKLQEALKELE